MFAYANVICYEPLTSEDISRAKHISHTRRGISRIPQGFILLPKQKALFRCLLIWRRAGDSFYAYQTHLLVFHTAQPVLCAKAGAGKRRTVAFSFPPFESPRFYDKSKAPPDGDAFDLAEGRGFLLRISDTPACIPYCAAGLMRKSRGGKTPHCGVFFSALRIPTIL
jgi:hypothetical protein